jgi:hypothetical protein
MTSVYSTCFMDSAAVVLPGVQTYVVPSGFIAVLRNITVYCFARDQPFGYHGTTPLAVNILESGCTLFIVPTGNIRNGMYYWEGREVVTAGDGFSVLTFYSQFQYRLNGFLLTAP